MYPNCGHTIGVANRVGGNYIQLRRFDYIKVSHQLLFVIVILERVEIVISNYIVLSIIVLSLYKFVLTLRHFGG